MMMKDHGRKEERINKNNRLKRDQESMRKSHRNKYTLHLQTTRVRPCQWLVLDVSTRTHIYNHSITWCIHIIRPVNMSTFGQSTDRYKNSQKHHKSKKRKAGIPGNHRFFSFLDWYVKHTRWVLHSWPYHALSFMGEVPYRLELSGPMNHKRSLLDFNVLYEFR